jgi:hypothetical protein
MGDGDGARRVVFPQSETDALAYQVEPRENGVAQRLLGRAQGAIVLPENALLKVELTAETDLSLLEWLRPGDVQILDASARSDTADAVRAIALVEGVEHVVLSGARLDAGAMTILGSMDSLRRLDVRDAQLDSEAIVALALADPPLQMLLLGGAAGVDDEAVAAVAALGTLRRLDLSGTAVGGEGLTSLRVLLALELLDLRETQVSTESIERLQRLLPNCTIHSG